MDDFQKAISEINASLAKARKVSELPPLPDINDFGGLSLQGRIDKTIEKINELDKNQRVLYAMVQTIFAVLTPQQRAAYLENYDRILTGLQMKIVSSNPPKENNQQ